MRRVRINQATDYDLLGEVIDEAADGSELASFGASSLIVRPSDGRRVALRTIS
jgi:hypothetical protein